MRICEYVLTLLAMWHRYGVIVLFQFGSPFQLLALILQQDYEVAGGADLCASFSIAIGSSANRPPYWWTMFFKDEWEWAWGRRSAGGISDLV